MTAEVATPATGSSTRGNSDVAASGMHSAIHQRATQNVAPSVANAGALSPEGTTPAWARTMLVTPTNGPSHSATRLGDNDGMRTSTTRGETLAVSAPP